MPQVVAFVASAITAASSAVASATLAVTGSATLAAAAGNFTLGLLSLGTMTSELAGIAGTLGAVVGISGLSALAAPKPPPYHTQLSATKSSIGQRSMLMGRTAVGGTINTDYMTSGRKNGVSSIVYTLSHVGKSGYVESVIWGQDTITFNSPVNGIQAAIGKYNGAMWLVQKSGDWSQSAININLGGNGLEAGAHPSEWRSTDRCGGCLTVMLIIGNTHSVFKENSHNPIFVTNANEVDLIDPRTGAAATTTAQKTNPWVWAYSYAQKWLSSTGIKVAGIGLIAATQLITSSFSYAANIADTNNWKIGGEIKIDPNNAFNDLRNIAQAGGGDISFKNGKLVATIAAPKTPSAIITEDDLRDRPIWQSAVETSKLPNRIIPRFISEANLWQVVDGTVITDSSFVTQQNGNKITTTLDLPYSVGATQSGQLAAYGLLNAREPIKWSIPLKPQARFIGSNGDCVQLQFPNCGFATHNIIITKLTVNNDLSIDIEGISETDGKDDWALGKTTTPPDFSTITPYDLTNIPQPDVGQWTANATTITGGDTIIPIIRITGSNSDYLAASGIIVKYRLNTTGSPWLGSFNLQKTATNFEINEVSPNTSYIIGIAYLGITGLEGSVRELSAVTTGNLQAGISADGSAALSAVGSITDQNILGKEEKPDYIKLWNTVQTEYTTSNWVSTASGLGITTEVTAYQNAYVALTNYLNGLTIAGGASTNWYDYTTNTAINRTNWNNAWQGYDTTKLALQAKINAVQKVNNDNVTLSNSSKGLENQNAGFDVYTNPTGVPDYYYDWANAATNSNRINDGTGGYAYRLHSVAGSNTGIFQNIDNSQLADRYVVLIAKVSPVHDGDLIGAGMHLSNNVTMSVNFPFATTPDAYGNVVGGGRAGVSYVFGKLFKFDATATGTASLYLMNHWNGLGAVSNANDIEWLEFGWRYATEAEIKTQTIEVGADVTGNNTALAIVDQGGLATANYQRGASYSGTPTAGSLWSDTSVSPEALRQYIGGSWVKIAEINATTFSISASGTFSETHNTAGTKTTNTVTLTPSGGTSPYTYDWRIISWETDQASAYGVPKMTSKNTATSAVTCYLRNNETLSGIAQCIVTDNTGKTATIEVAFIFTSTL